MTHGITMAADAPAANAPPIMVPSVVGLVPAAVGLALLLSSVLEARDLEKQQRPQERPPADP